VPADDIQLGKRNLIQRSRRLAGLRSQRLHHAQGGGRVSDCAQPYLFNSRLVSGDVLGRAGLEDRRRDLTA
jgi:hypothetical protein